MSWTLLDIVSYFACSLDSRHPQLDSTQQIATISTGKLIWNFLPCEMESSIMQHRLESKYMHRFLLSSSPPFCLDQLDPHYSYQIHTKDSFTLNQSGCRCICGEEHVKLYSLPLFNYMMWYLFYYTFTRMF